jgi:uncharacterized protein YndB with AHSA1/START domain
MSNWAQQAVIDAPAAEVWRLVGDPRRYPEWWPRILEVRGERFEEGSEFVQVTRVPLGREETTFRIDRMEELREVRMHCTKSGTFAHWRLTDAQGGTFVEIRTGMEPFKASDRLFDLTLGRAFFRRWTADSLEALRQTLRARTAA